METLYRIKKISIFMLIALSYLSFSPMKNVICVCKQSIQYCVKEDYKHGQLYYIISLAQCESPMILDTLVKNNILYFK